MTSRHKSEMKRQEWRCDLCHGVGYVKYESGAGVQEVMDLLRTDHADSSPECQKNNGMLKVRALSMKAGSR